MPASTFVGATFAEVNPPMSVKAVSVPISDIPRPWHPSAVQSVAPCHSPRLMAQLTGTDSQPVDDSEPWRHAPIFGVVTVINEVWTPNSVRSVPPSVTNRLGMHLSAQWAMLFNGSDIARRRHHFAVVTVRGTVLILTSIGPKTRPANPSDFPPCVVGGLTMQQAVDAAIAANTPRCEFARVPREWTIAVRRADSVDAEGGAA